MKTLLIVGIAIALGACAGGSTSKKGKTVSLANEQGVMSCDPRRFDCHLEARGICGADGYQIIGSGGTGSTAAGRDVNSRADDPFGAARGGSTSRDPFTGYVNFKCKAEPESTK
ncbi:MAG: hypothetical protein R3358_02715 [Woeseiaceae bacterium]|nr:hypothetical protein [Woeseiaceae bacterium]